MPQKDPAGIRQMRRNSSYLWNRNHKSPVAEGDSTREVSDTSRVVGGRGVFTLRALRSTGRNELLSKRGRSQT